MISTSQAAALLSISRRWLVMLLDQGRIPGAVQINKTWVLPDNPVISPPPKLPSKYTAGYVVVGSRRKKASDK